MCKVKLNRQCINYNTGKNGIDDTVPIMAYSIDSVRVTFLYTMYVHYYTVKNE